MADFFWEPKTDNLVNQVATLTVGSNTNTHTFIVSAKHPSGGISTSVTILTVTADGVLTTAQLATAIADAWNASTHEFAVRVTAQAVSSTVVFASDFAGVPFRISRSGTGTSSIAATTPNVGPNDWSCPNNWKGGAIPANGGDVFIQGSQSILYGLDTGITPVRMVFEKYSGTAGGPGTPLTIDPDNVIVNCDGLVYLDITSATAVATLDVLKTSGASPYGLYVTCNTGVGAGITLARLYAGTTKFLGASTRVVTLVLDDGLAFFDSSANVSTAKVSSGTLFYYSIDAGSFVTLQMDDGHVETFGLTDITTVTINGGLFVSNSTGTITTLNANGGLSDFLQSKAARTVTTINQQQGSQVWYDDDFVTVGTHNKAGPMKYVAEIAGSGGSKSGFGGGYGGAR